MSKSTEEQTISSGYDKDLYGRDYSVLTLRKDEKIALFYGDDADLVEQYAEQARAEGMAQFRDAVKKAIKQKHSDAYDVWNHVLSPANLREGTDVMDLEKTIDAIYTELTEGKS